MADAPDVAAVPGKAVGGLGHKLGPFPVWVWLVGGTIVVVVGYHFISTSSGGQGVNPLGGILPPGTFAGGSGTPAGGGTSTGDTAAATSTPLTNAQWLSNVAPSVAAALQIPVSEASLYISQWLSGETPFGLNQAGSSLYNSVVGAAQATSFGAPPSPPSNTVNLNPYASNQSYLSALLNFIPSGTSQSIITELTNLYSGFTTTISQDAASVLQTAQGYAGLAPLPINYTIGPTSGSVGSALSVTADDINQWQNKYLTGAAATFSTWVSSAPAAIQQAFSTSQLQALYNYFNVAAQPGGPLHTASSASLASVINGYIANPNTIPSSVPQIAPMPKLTV